MTVQDKKEIPFETALAKLEEIVEKLEASELPLEEALKKYEEGVRMAEICQRRLHDAEKRIEILMKTNAGKFKTVPFEESGKEDAKTKKK